MFPQTATPQKSKHLRAALRHNWRREWSRYTAFNIGPRPQSNRRSRRNDWRDEWRIRESGEFI
jgi:hypothetical protein